MFDNKNSFQYISHLILLVLILIAAGSPSAWASNGIKTKFLTAYPSAVGSRLATLPSAPNHCGACHYVFSDVATPSNLNPYGEDIDANGTSPDDILAIGSLDSDGDGFSNNDEIKGTGFTNIPTFPGLTPSNVSNVSGVTRSEINGFLVPVVATQSGSLQVTLGPAAAVTAGAQWNVDGGAWKNSAATVTGLSVGSHTVNYKAVTGWTAPVSESVSITNGVTTAISRSYTLDAECAIDDDCDDDLFCNGDEKCEDGECVAGEDEDPCEDNETCIEENDACVECVNDNDCDDGLFCNGDEQCEDGECVAGEDEDPCEENENCIEEGDACVECVNDDDCEEDEICEDNLCVIPACDPEIETIDLDGNCLLSKEELKSYNDFIKGRQTTDKEALKTKHTTEKNYIKYLKETYAE